MEPEVPKRLEVVQIHYKDDTKLAYDYLSIRIDLVCELTTNVCTITLKEYGDAYYDMGSRKAEGFVDGYLEACRQFNIPLPTVFKKSENHPTEEYEY